MNKAMRCKVLWPGRLGSSTIANVSKISAIGNKDLLPTASEKTRRGNSGDRGLVPRDAERQESDSLNSGAKRGDGVRVRGGQGRPHLGSSILSSQK